MVSPPSTCRVLFAANLYASAAGAPPELYCAALDGSPPVRLTYCNTDERSWALIEAAPSPLRPRVAVRRVTSDTNGDGRLTEADGAALAFFDLSRNVQSELVPATAFVSGMDWSPADDLIVYSAAGAAGRDDLFRHGVTSGDQVNTNWTQSPDTSERRPRIDRYATLIFFGRIDTDGKGTVWVGTSGALQQLTEGGQSGEPLPGTPYRVGSDADAAASPDVQQIVFRRLVAVGEGSGHWNLLTLDLTTTSGPRLITSAPAYRGAPDWGNEGIIFSETDPATGRSRLVLVDATGSFERVILIAPPGLEVSFPRWLPTQG
jgi:Tol biopolymer transport system component